MKNLVVIGLAFLWITNPAPAAPTGVLKTRACSITLSNGVVVGLGNRLCGETLVKPPGGGGALTGLHRLQPPDLRLDQATHRLLSSTSTGLTWEAAWDVAGARMQTRAEGDARAGDMVILQQANLGTNGLAGISWGISSVPDDLEVLVPGCSGQRFSADAPAGRRTFDYPFTWEAPFVLIQGRRGGVVIWADDASARFKSLVLDHSQRAFRLRFESRNLAPFEDKSSITSSRWRIRAYVGNWQVGAAIYREWATARFNLMPLERKGSAWARNIGFVVTMALDQGLLPALAANCNPAQTLLYVASWRKDGYDRNYPDYTAAPGLAPFMAEAHRLGFRVMLHVNYFGCDPKNAAYDGLKQWQIRDPFTGELQWWEWPAQPPIKFAYINPASDAWRKLLTQRLADVARQYSVDAFHLDQTLCIYNDKNGLIDGLNCIEGSLALHRELREALPEVALSGEGLNEITSQHEHFAQRHIWSMDHVHHTWDDRQIAMSHPISSSVLTPYTHIYGYLGMANPTDSKHFSIWRRAYEPWGVLPTYCWPNKAQLQTLTPPVTALLEQARFFQSNLPVPDYETPWSGREIFRYKLKGGGWARFVRDQGVAFEAKSGSAQPQILCRRIEGVEQAKVGGSIPGWLGFDAHKIIGLNPQQAYEWSPAPADATVPHISSLPKGYMLSRCDVKEGTASFEIARSPLETAKQEITLWNYTGSVTGGVRLASGQVRLPGGLEFEDEETAGTVHPDGDGLFIHPPWKAGSQPAGGPHSISFVEFPLRLPRAPKVSFTSDVQLRGGAEGKSDGVTFTVTATCKGEARTRSVHHAQEKPASLDLDLSSWSGKRVVLRLEADPGPAGSVTFDWGRFVRPRIAVQTGATVVRETVRLEGIAPSQEVVAARGMLAIKGQTKMRQASGKLEIRCDLPNTLSVQSRIGRRPDSR